MTTSTHNELTREQKRMIEECYLLGRLADDGPSLPRLGLDFGVSVSISKLDGPEDVVFYIEAVSKEPELLRTVLGKSREEVYISFGYKNRRYLESIGYFKQDNKVEFLRNHFKDKRILFKPVLSPDRTSEGGYHYNFEIVLVEKVDDGSDLSQQFIPIPVLSNSLTASRFERKLIDGKPIELTCHNHSHDIPEFIVCSGYIYHIPDETVFDKYLVNDNMYICRKPEEIKRIPTPPSIEHHLKVMHKEIAFASSDKRIDWIDEIDEQGIAITKIEDEKQEKDKNKKTSNKIKVELEAEVTEGDFILRLDYLARKNKLRYSLDDLYNFHTSLKTSNFTILGGMSGTGKTQLAMLYAEAMKMKDGDNLLFVPVKPSYTEPSDLLGYFNPQTGVFTESEVGLVSFLYKASKNPKNMYMVVFDEMNLGQVEHYFSDFLSVLELEGSQRRLKLFGEGTYCVQDHLKEGIEIGNNVLFVGTANFDETTRDFSNRMLDRSNVIILEKISFADAQKHELKENIQTPGDYENQEKNEIKNPDLEIKSTNYNSWINRSDKRLSLLSDDEVSILDKLHEEISNFDSQTGVSFRIAEQISHYLENIPKDDLGNSFMSRTKAFDYQIKQRILTKIRGHREQIEKLVGVYDSVDGYIEEGRLNIILSGEQKTDFAKSLEFLEQKAKELMRNGYTL